jgi:hypothetical protein
VYEWKHLIADLAACEDESVWIIALAAVGWQDVNLDRLEGELVYLDAQLGGKIVETCSFVVRRGWWATQRGEESTLARAGMRGRGRGRGSGSGSGGSSRSESGSGSSESFRSLR